MTDEEGATSFWRLIAVGALSALLSGSLVAITLRIGIATDAAEQQSQTQANTKSIEKLITNMETLSDLFRTQLVETTRLQTRLDSFVEAIRNNTESK